MGTIAATVQHQQVATTKYSSTGANDLVLLERYCKSRDKGPSSHNTRFSVLSPMHILKYISVFHDVSRPPTLLQSSLALNL